MKEKLSLIIAILAAGLAIAAMIIGPGFDDLDQREQKITAEVLAVKNEVVQQISSTKNDLMGQINMRPSYIDFDYDSKNPPTYELVEYVWNTDGDSVLTTADGSDSTTTNKYTVGFYGFIIDSLIEKKIEESDEPIKDELAEVQVQTEKNSKNISALWGRNKKILAAQEDMVKQLNSINVQILDLQKNQNKLFSQKFVKVEELSRVTSRIDSLFYISDSLGLEIEDLSDELANAKTLATTKKK